jgi:CheY-like chemotaxis protein
VTTILVVENDPDVSDFLTNVLQAELAAVVRSASTGTLGAEAIETGAFDLAIIDVLAPEVSGYDLAKCAANKNAPALLYRASGGPGQTREVWLSSSSQAVQNSGAGLPGRGRHHACRGQHRPRQGFHCPTSSYRRRPSGHDG